MAVSLNVQFTSRDRVISYPSPHPAGLVVPTTIPVRPCGSHLSAKQSSSVSPRPLFQPRAPNELSTEFPLFVNPFFDSFDIITNFFSRVFSAQSFFASSHARRTTTNGLSRQHLVSCALSCSCNIFSRTFAVGNGRVLR